MKKIHFDYPGLQNNIYPSLNSAINNLRNASNTLSSMGIPSGCPYAGYLRNSGAKVSNCVNRLNSVLSDSNDTNSKLNTVVDNFTINLSKIPITKISK
ncbi:MAG: hypothetical protein IJ193_02300 [Bacilli bacterium]|nr:hypothetical protein [Bacilli bacterium]